MRDVVVFEASLHSYGVFPDNDFVSAGVEACQRALEDAKVDFKAEEQVEMALEEEMCHLGRGESS